MEYVVNRVDPFIGLTSTDGKRSTVFAARYVISVTMVQRSEVPSRWAVIIRLPEGDMVESTYETQSQAHAFVKQIVEAMVEVEIL